MLFADTDDQLDGCGPGRRNARPKFANREATGAPTTLWHRYERGLE
jgi:hypothetical protein